MYLALALVEFDHAVFQCKQCVVATATHVHAGMETGSKLTNENGTCRYFLATEALYTATLCITVATITG